MSPTPDRGNFRKNQGNKSLDSEPIDGSETRVKPKRDRESIKKLGNLGEVIQREKTISRDEDEIFVTKLHISSWTITLLDIIMNEYKLTSERKMYLSCLSLGTVLLEESLDSIVKSQKDLRAKILLDNNRIKASLASRHSKIRIGSDPVVNGERVTVVMPNWVKDTLGEIAEHTGVQVSSLRRIAIYTALKTIDIPETYQDDINMSIRGFKRSIAEVLDIYKEWG